MEAGTKVKQLDIVTTNPELTKLSDLDGQNVVLFFYPKDNTPGCTQEGKDFTDALEKFSKLNTTVLGISRDSLASHHKFIDKYQFPFDLISDEDETLCQYFKVIKEKNMFGRKVMGIERSTFLLDEAGIVKEVWRKVKVPGHVDAVLDAIKQG